MIFIALGARVVISFCILSQCLGTWWSNQTVPVGIEVLADVHAILYDGVEVTFMDATGFHA